jgi:PadR family transcriptional regulator, regulatory protein PadR
MGETTEEVRQGTLDLLVLKTLSIEPAHGWAIAQRIQQLSRDVFQVNQGSLYPALHRLEHEGLVAAEWRASDNNRRAKYYGLTAAGRRRLARETDSWQRFAGAVWNDLEAT